MNTRFVLALVALACAQAVLATPHAAMNGPRAFLEGGDKHPLPEGWTMAPADPTHMKRLTFAIRQQNVDVLKKHVDQISDPRHTRYGEQLSIDDITSIIAPSVEDQTRVLDFVESFPGVTDVRVTRNRDYVIAFAPVASIEERLQIRLHAMRHERTGVVQVRTTDAYSVPAHLAGALEFIGGVYALPSEKILSSRHAAAAAAAGPMDSIESITPQQIAESYNISGVDVDASTTQSTQAVIEFQGQYFSTKDLATFQKAYGLPRLDVAKIVNNGAGAGLEASLDIEYIMGVGINVTTWFYYDSAGGFSFMDQVLNWANVMGNQTDAPLVQSVSYGEPEHEIPVSLMDRINTEFVKLGARRISVIFASGDSGVGNYFCLEEAPDFCASSPYVTAVGATQLDSSDGEVGTTLSGGGFSKNFAMPSYQQQAVQDFLANGSDLPPAHTYHKSNRARPDVAAFGMNFQVVMGGGFTSVAGTSCAAPTVAGVVGLLNDARLKAGKTALGFLNPLIYQNTAAWNDITADSGKNTDVFCVPGFECQTGYEPYTGVGSPNYGKLLEFVMSLP